MKTEEQFLKIEKTARYYSNDPDVNKPGSLWIVIHGYAQLAKDFIDEFEFLNENRTLIVAPEGLSKFYTRNRIGASWMTKEDRINEINDYLKYLDGLFSNLKIKYDLSAAKINLLGFSQGVHTAVRWYISSNIVFDNLILCSSDFPGDADFIKLNQKLEKSKMFYIYGNKDEVISGKTFSAGIELLKSENIPFENIVFEGKHEIQRETLKSVINTKNHSV